MWRKKFRLMDYCDNFGLVGDFDTYEEMVEYAEEWEEETDGECNLAYYEWNNDIHCYAYIGED